MALIKFNRTAKRAEATDADTLYFPTDEQSIYLGGKRVGGDRVSHADSADSATSAGSATSAETANIANKANQLSNALTLTYAGGDTKLFDGSAPVTFALSTAAGKAVDTYITNSPSANLPTSDAVRAYVNSQIKNYTSAFRYAGTLGWVNSAWQVNDIPADISDNDHMDYGTFVGYGEDDSLLKVGFSFYVNVGGEFVNREVVEPGDMVTCVGLYNGEGSWEPSYQIVNSNITVTEQLDNSTKVPTSKAVKDAIEANKYTHPSHTATTGVPTANAAPGFGGTFQVNQIASDSQGHVTSSTPRTITIPQTLASENDRGLMSSEQFRNLNAVLDALTWK